MLHTVNSEIFARVLFLRNFAYLKNKTLAKIVNSPRRLLIHVNQVANCERRKYDF